MKWGMFLFMGTTVYLWLDPRIETRYTTHIVQTKCPPQTICPEPEECSIVYKEPDQVYVISQDLPCRCWDDE